VDDLQDLSRKDRTQLTEENVTHFADFLFETAKALPTKASTLRTLIRDSTTTILAFPKPELPSLSMRSRFKLEDTKKCVQ
jgi:hypothetical protein